MHNINHTYTRTHVCMRTRSCMHTWILQNKDKLLHSRPLGLEIQSINASTRQTLTIMKTKSLTLEVIRLSFKMQNVIAHLQSVIAWPHLLSVVPKPSYPRGERVPCCSAFPPTDLPWQSSSWLRSGEVLPRVQAQVMAVDYSWLCPC